MASWLAIAKRLIRFPDLTGNARRTFRYHLAYAVIDGTAGGILLSAPLVGIKHFGAPNWQLPMRELFAGAGMIATLYLGCWMAQRRKMPFVIIPGVLAGVSALMMAWATHSALWFTLLGLSLMFAIVTRPATTAILRLNYPVEHRGHATGEVRKWSSLAFVVSSLVTASILQYAEYYREANGAVAHTRSASELLSWSTVHTPQIIMIVAGILSLLSFVCFRQIRVEEDPEKLRDDFRPEIVKTLRDAWEVAARDSRYRRYLLACFVGGFSQGLYLPLLWAYLHKDLGFEYLLCIALMHAIPAFVAFISTGAIGQALDRSNPWVCWAWIRFVLALDAFILATTQSLDGVLAAAVILLPVVARVLRGSVQGAWWILWWQIGVTHFAPPGEDTSRYMGIMVFVYGAIRIGASAAGMVLAMMLPTVALIVVGGLGVTLAGFYSLWQSSREKREHQPDTMADFEHQFADAEFR
jgi:hypothetical protein